MQTGSHNFLFAWLLKQQAKKLIRLAVDGNVLDVGSGTKPYLDEMLKQAESVTHLDLKPGADIQADFTKWRGTQVYDTITAFQVLEHVTDPDLFMLNASIHLENRGKMIVTVPFMWREHEEPLDFHRWTRYGLAELADKHGFEVRLLEPSTGFWLAIALQINYYLLRLPLARFWLAPFFVMHQIVAYGLDLLDVKYRHRYTAGWSMILEKR